jgi:hypothetical protein
MGVHTDISSGQRGYGGPAFQQPFEREIERTLTPLWGLRQRASLFSISIGSLGQERTLALVRRALAHVGPTGSLRDGGSGLLYVGPRERGSDGDRRLERWVADVMGWTVFYLTNGCTGADVDVVAVHRWLDEISSADELVEPLMGRCPAGAARRLTVG